MTGNPGRASRGVAILLGDVHRAFEFRMIMPRLCTPRVPTRVPRHQEFRRAWTANSAMQCACPVRRQCTAWATSRRIQRRSIGPQRRSSLAIEPLCAYSIPVTGRNSSSLVAQSSRKRSATLGSNWMPRLSRMYWNASDTGQAGL